MRTRTVPGLLLFAAILSTVVACGGSSGSSPAAPSTTSAASGNATIVGLVNGAGAGTNVTAVGTTASATVDASGHFQLTSIPSGDVQLRFTASGVNASATVPQVGEQQLVQITVSVSGNTATITADVRGGSGASAEVEGVVTAVAGSCPALTLTIGATTITTTMQTTFAGGGCGDVKTGVKVDAKGTRQSDGSIAAQSVRVEIEDASMEVEGVVSALSGSCPALTFTVSGTTVKTDASTMFSGGVCADVASGRSVDAEGTKQADGSLLAKSVKIETAQQDFEGTVTAIDTIGGTFQVSGKTVKVGTQTVIRHGSTMMQFSDIKVGYRVHVKGMPDASGAIVASEVNIQNDNPTPPTTEGQASGAVGSVTGSCPTVSFMVSGTTVTTGAMTTYAAGTCADIKAGASVAVTGLVQPDKSLAASSVKFNKTGNGK